MNTRLVISVLISFALLIYMYQHPILLKLFGGTARFVGKKEKAVIYIDGKVDTNSKLFYTQNDKVKGIILLFEKNKRREIIYVNLDRKNVGLPVGGSKKDFDVTFGVLIQSEVGRRYVPFDDSMKGYNFNSNLSLSKNKISFNLPSELQNRMKGGKVNVEILE